jgi:amino acid transporter
MRRRDDDLAESFLVDDESALGTKSMSPPPAPSQQKIGLFTLCMLLFSQASAGPCGLEAIVGAVGVWLSMLSQAGTVLLFSIPQAVMAIELSRGVSHNGGYALWAESHLSRTWAAAVGIWGITANCAYSSSLVQNIADYLKIENEHLADRWIEFGFVCALAVGGAVVCAMPLKRAGDSFTLITGFTVGVFAALLGLSGRRMRVVAEPIVPRGTANTSNWASMVDMLIFNAIYLDGAATYAGETRNPDRTIPIAITIITIVVTSVNLITTFVTYFGAGDPASAWGGGHFAVVAARVSGPRLRDAIVANAFATNFQILTSNVQNASYVLASMASRGLAPHWLRAPREDAVPLRAVALCCGLTVLFGLVPFELSVAIQAVFYGGVVLVECASYVSKRTRAGSSVDACLVAMLPAMFTAFSYYVQNRLVFAACFGAMVASLAVAHGLLWRTDTAAKPEPPTKPYVLRKRKPEASKSVLL